MLTNPGLGCFARAASARCREKGTLMPDLASTARASAPGAKVDRVGDDERLDIAQSAMIVVALSLASWTGLAFLLRWAIG